MKRLLVVIDPQQGTLRRYVDRHRDEHRYAMAGDESVPQPLPAFGEKDNLEFVENYRAKGAADV